MHSPHKPHVHTLDTEVQLQRTDVHEKLRQFRMRKERQNESQVAPRQTRGSRTYGNVPNDLDQIACAATETEIVDLINQVLEVLQRSGRMPELPEELCIDKLSNLQELRVALRRLQGDMPFAESLHGDSDSLCVLRAVLTAAEERSRQIKRRK